MAALISWACHVDHTIPDRTEYQPIVTLHEGRWAYCKQGGNDNHRWDAIEPEPVEQLRARHVTEAAPDQRFESA